MLMLAEAHHWNNVYVAYATARSTAPSVLFGWGLPTLLVLLALLGWSRDYGVCKASGPTNERGKGCLDVSDTQMCWVDPASPVMAWFYTFPVTFALATACVLRAQVAVSSQFVLASSGHFVLSSLG
jgi:hypothetical protein